MTATARVGVGVPFEIMNTICAGSTSCCSDFYFDPANYRLARDIQLRQQSDDEDDEEDEDRGKDDDDDEDGNDGNNGNDGYSE
jgi:hypothetical protein